MLVGAVSAIIRPAKPCFAFYIESVQQLFLAALAASLDLHTRQDNKRTDRNFLVFVMQAEAAMAAEFPLGNPLEFLSAVQAFSIPEF